jgi:uncharacterized protein YutE (UPF0331/DUF86 family)
MDRLIVERKLDSLRRCLARVRSKTPPDVTTLAVDLDLQDVLVLNLSRAVQICVDLATHVLSGLDQPPPDTMGQSFELLAQAKILDPALATRLLKAVGFRNLAVHNYAAIDWAIVHAIATRHLGNFDEFAKHIDRYSSSTGD